MRAPLRAVTRRTARLTVAVGAVTAALLSVHCALNAALLRRPHLPPAPVDEPVSVLLPMRDEARHVVDCLRGVLATQGLADLQVLVLDDGSRDATGDLARAVAAGDARVRVLTGTPPPPGWLGKPWALAQLAEAATGTVLVTVDADVRLTPWALAATVDLLRRHRLALVSPYPRQDAVGAAERLVQPLLQWSWLTLLPLRPAERSPRASLSAANGQLLAVDAAALARAGSFAAVRGAVLDDIALLRAVKAAGGRGGVADGTRLASCRMYTSWAELSRGYTKSLWSAAPSLLAAAGLLTAAAVVYVLPPLAALTGSPVGAAGYAAAVAGRVVAARRTGGRAWPDALAHPASVLAVAVLLVRSRQARRAGTLHWKGRPLARAAERPL